MDDFLITFDQIRDLGNNIERIWTIISRHLDVFSELERTKLRQNRNNIFILLASLIEKSKMGGGL